MLLSWMFISYTTIYFFVKKFIFLNVYNFSEYNIRMSLYVFLNEKGSNHLKTPNKSGRYTNSVTSDISKSLRVRFHIVWSRLNYFPVHQPAVRNPMHFHSTHTPHLQHLHSLQVWIWNPAKHLPNIFCLFCENSQRVEAVGYFHRGAPSWMLVRIINATLPNNLFPLGHPWFTPTQRPLFLQ